MTVSPAQNDPPIRRTDVTRYNQRMAKRIARRAHVNEEGVAVAFTFNNLATMVAFGLVEDIVGVIPSIGSLIESAITLVSFYFHRIVLVTETSVYIFRDYPFHIPGARLQQYERGPGLVRMGSDKTGWWSRLIRRGQLTFSDGTVVYHSPIWIRRASYIYYEGNAGTRPAINYAAAAAAAGGVPAYGSTPDGGQWAADPSGRHQYRWWDGKVWTEHVSTNGVASNDPI